MCGRDQRLVELLGGKSKEIRLVESRRVTELVLAKGDVSRFDWRPQWAPRPGYTRSGLKKPFITQVADGGLVAAGILVKEKAQDDVLGIFSRPFGTGSLLSGGTGKNRGRFNSSCGVKLTRSPS